MVTFLTILHVFVCLFLILVVLLQAGKGGGMGIAFGGGGSQTVFGSAGAGDVLTRLTSLTAGVFMLTSLGLAHYSSQQDSRRLQQLDARKKAEKKAEDERAAKLKTNLEKATQAAFPKGAPGTGMTGAGTAGAAGIAVPVPPPPAAVETGAKPTPAPKGTTKKDAP